MTPLSYCTVCSAPGHTAAHCPWNTVRLAGRP